jgi:hypothetical protein
MDVAVIATLAAFLIAWPAPPFDAWLDAQSAHIRQRPDASAREVGLLVHGDAVTVTGCVPSCDDPSAWALLREDGAVRLALLRPAPEPAGSAARGSAARYRYGRLQKTVAVRAAPDASARVLGHFRRGHDLAFRIDDELLARGWLQRPSGGFIAARHVRIAIPSPFSGLHDPPYATAFVIRKTPPFARYDRTPVLALEEGAVRVPGGTLPRRAVRIAIARPRPAQVPAHARWVHIDLREQVLTAYEGDRLVFATLVSTGKAGDETRTGIYRVYFKTIHAAMRGHKPADRYFVDEVPFVQYFHTNDALHGTYWHDRFGTRRSHGCVNLSIADARWLFEWAPPPLPQGWHAIEPDAAGRGTLWVQVEYAPAVRPGPSLAAQVGKCRQELDRLTHASTWHAESIVLKTRDASPTCDAARNPDCRGSDERGAGHGKARGFRSPRRFDDALCKYPPSPRDRRAPPSHRHRLGSRRAARAAGPA